jgi:MoxR-like ATPase
MELNGWDKADFALSNGLGRVLFYGPPGTGKTYYGLHYHLNGSKAYRLICTQEMTDIDLIGGMRQGDDGIWRFREGVGIRAWREGARLVVDEINRVNADVESRLMALIDTSDSSEWQNEYTGEIVKPHAGFSVVATMNGEPEDLAPAILDRLVVRVQINESHPEAIASLPEYLRDLASKVTHGNYSDRYSLRSFVEFARVYEASEDLDKSVQVCLPTLTEELGDAVALRVGMGF